MLSGVWYATFSWNVPVKAFGAGVVVVDFAVVGVVVVSAPAGDIGVVATGAAIVLSEGTTGEGLTLVTTLDDEQAERNTTSKSAKKLTVKRTPEIFRYIGYNK